MAKLIRNDLTITGVKPANGKTFSLKELQRLVGGYIQIVKTFDGQDMYINEEGKLKGLPLNMAATLMYEFGFHDPIVGDALLPEPDEISNEDD